MKEKMSVPELENCLSGMVLLVDTREQENFGFKRRMEKIPCAKRREKLTSGDYSAECVLPDGSVYSLKDKVAIERKMSLDEICANFCAGRERFIKEFERFVGAGGKLYILIENASWEKVCGGMYETKMNKDALMASLLAWGARYNTQFIFCDSFISPAMIYKILYFELREHLKKEAGE